jgi:hypothetical protein
MTFDPYSMFGDIMWFHKVLVLLGMALLGFLDFKLDNKESRQVSQLLFISMKNIHNNLMSSSYFSIS